MKAQNPKARIMAGVAIFLVAAYVLVSLLIVIPNKTITAPLSGLESATKPFFSQNWRVFAPKILKVNTNLQVQAQWRDDTGELVRSDWVDLTEIEQRSVAGHSTPSRISKSSANAATTYSSRFNKLNAEQKKIVRDTFIKNNGDGTFSPKATKSVTDQLLQHGENPGQIRNILNYDALLVQYTGTFATAYFGHEIERLRWRIYRSKPNDFIHRFEEEQQFEPTIVSFGWRHFEHTVTPEELSVHKETLKRYGAIK